MTIWSAIEKAIEGGWRVFAPSDEPIKVNMKGTWPMIFGTAPSGVTKLWPLHVALLDSAFWKALGKTEGWADSKYRACEMKMPFYSGEAMRGIGAIVGESKDGTQWYIRWDHRMNGKPTRGMTKQPYPKENIIAKGGDKNYLMVMHRLIDALAEGKTPEQYFETL